MDSTDGVFDILFLIGRPAAGKSEIIDYLKRQEIHERRAQFKIAAFEEFDDFPIIWSWFEEDTILSRRGKQRLHSDEKGYFLDNDYWNVLIERLEMDYWKREKEQAAFGKKRTAIIEFARGVEHGGFSTAFQQFSPDLLERAAVLYIQVPFEESLRKNRERKNPDRPHSILEHSLEDEKIFYLYKEVDWEELSGDDPEYLHISGVKVPYMVFKNGDDVTTGAGTHPEMSSRLKNDLSALWKLYEKS